MSDLADALSQWADWLDQTSAPSRPATIDAAAVHRSILSALGYLPVGQVPDDAGLAAVRGLLFQEASDAGLWPADPAAPPDADAALFDRLAQALELRPEAGLGLPEPGEVSLRSRVLQAQLALLGARQRPVGRPVDDGDDQDLIALATWLDEPGSLRGAALTQDRDHGRREQALAPFAALASDADTLMEMLIARDPSGFLVASRPSFPGIQLATEDVYTMPRDAAFPAGTFVDDGTFAALPADAPKPLLTEAFDNDPEEMIQDDANRLGLRLIQVKLKRRGVYAGPIDGLFGGGTWAALAETTRPMQPDEPSAGLLMTIRVLPSSVHVAVAFRLLAARALPRSKATAAQLHTLLLAQPEADLAQGLQRLQDAEMAPDTPPPPPPATFSLWRSLRDLAHRVLEVVSEGLHRVAEFVSEMLQPLRDLLAWIRAMARRLVALARAGLAPFEHLMFAEPFGNTVALSRIWLDRDMVTFVAAPSGMVTQLDTYSHDSRVLDWAGRVLVVVVQIVAAALTGPILWARLARVLMEEIPDLLGPLAADA